MAPTDDEKRKIIDGTSAKERPKKRVNKPLIEKRRRERINECLNQLQTLISQLDKDKYKVGRPAKLEKADILEMTVEFVKRTKANLPGTVKTKDNSDTHDQSYIAGYRKCMDEIEDFCKKNNIPDDVKASLHHQIDSKIRQIKPEERAVDLTTKCDKNDAKLNEQLQLLTNNNQAIQPKNLPQVTSSNSAPMAQVHIIQRPVNPNGQVTVVCQKEPSTYVLVPTAAICQPIQIPSASSNFPVLVQNNSTNFEAKSNMIDRTGQIFSATNALPSSGQLVMFPNSSLSLPMVNTSYLPTISNQSGYKHTPHGTVVSSSTISPVASASFIPVCSSTVTPSTQATNASGTTAMKQSGTIIINNQSSELNNSVQNNNIQSEDMWRPW